MKYNAIIIDDEALARDMLHEMIKNIYPELNIIHQCGSLLEGVDFINQHSLDMIFLDIEMPKHKGNEIINFLNPLPCPIIFTSAHYKQHLLMNGLEDTIFLNKPINMEELKKAIEWVILLKNK